jgi:hypothetical protein
MKKHTLVALKQYTTWGGLLLTSIGIGITIYTTGSIFGNTTAVIGVITTVVGNIVSQKLEQYSDIETQKITTEMEDMKARVEFAEESADELLNHPAMKESRSEWEDKHQDDFK